MLKQLLVLLIFLRLVVLGGLILYFDVVWFLFCRVAISLDAI